MSDSDLEEIKLDFDFNNVHKTSSPCSSNSGRSWIGDSFRDLEQAKVVSLAMEANNENTQKMNITEGTSKIGISQNNRRRLLSAPCKKIRQSSGKLLRSIASAKQKNFCHNSQYSTENLVHANLCKRGNATFDPISFHSITGVLSEENSDPYIMNNLEPICLKTVASGDSSKNNVYSMCVNNKQKCSAKISQDVFFPTLKTKAFVERDSNGTTEASSCFSSEESINPFESSVFRGNRFKCKRKKHSTTGKSDMNFHLHESTQIEPENISPGCNQREYKTATSSYYKRTTDSYKIPFTVLHCGTQTDISFFTPRYTQIFDPVPNRSVANSWFMLHKATNTSNENCNFIESPNEDFSRRSVNFLHIKRHENDKVASNGSSHNLHKSSHNNTIAKCDQNMKQPCENSCFSRLFSCCF